MPVNRIATAIRNSLELDSLLTTAANEVGRALNVKSCAVQCKGALVGEIKSSYYFRSGPTVSFEEKGEILADVELVRACLPHSPKAWVIDGDDTHDTGVCAQAAVPLNYEGAFVGLVLAESDDASRVWADNELLLLHTVADQLTVAVKQAHMYSPRWKRRLLPMALPVVTTVIVRTPGLKENYTLQPEIASHCR